MVVIRQLKPLVRIQLPKKPPIVKSRRVITVVRRLADHPTPTPQPTPCRLWQGTVDNNGYGTWWVPTDAGGWRKVRPHRWVIEQLLERQLLASEVIIHRCDQPLCYRVSHLAVGTTAQNNADMVAKGRYVHAGGPVSQERVDRIRQMFECGFSRPAIEAALGESHAIVYRLTGDTPEARAYQRRRASREASTAARRKEEDAARDVPIDLRWVEGDEVPQRGDAGH